MIPRLFLLILIGLLSHIPAAHAKRVALLIGNAGYVSEKTLANPVRDARLLARMLKDDLKFDDVKLVENADRARLIELIDQFQRQAAGAEAAVFYFSGHGMQDGGKRNYLIPVDARIQGETGIRAYGVQADEVVAALASAGPRVSVVILDACRDNPYAGATRSGTKGLARMEVNTDQELLIAYATRDGQVALDGKGNNSPYAAALARHLKQAGQKPLLSLFDHVADQVRAETGNQQRPTRYGDLKASTYLLANLAPEPVAFSGTAPTLSRPASAVAPSTPSLDPGEAAYWAEVKKSEDPADYAAYLANYPNGRYLADANEYIERDKQAKVAREKLKEDQSWQKAQSGDSHTSYEAYLNAYPNGRYTALAKLKQKKLPPALTAGQIIKDCADCPEMVVLPAGNFEMGSDDGGLDEKPMRRVSVSSFALAKTEVTQGQWRAVMGNNPSFYSSCGDDCPVENVSWDDAQDFVGRISEKTGQTYRLPSEAEWEYACRAGGRHDYCGSDNVDAVAWYQNNSMEFKSRLLSASEWVGGQTSQVAKKQANAWGLFDMSGNLWEWVEDCYYGNYVGAPTDGSAWTSGACKQRVLRGGSWNVNPRGARSTSRYRLDTTYRFSNFSFRPARIISH